VTSQSDINDCPNLVSPQNYVATSNGCGPENGGADVLVLNGIGRAGPVNFNPSCNSHDLCYGKCEADKAACDATFGGNLRAACVAFYAKPGAPALGLPTCLALAVDFQAGVTLPPQATDAFLTAQEEACECCTTLYCITFDGNTCTGYLSPTPAQWTIIMNTCPGGVIVQNRVGATVNGCPSSGSGLGCCIGTSTTSPPPLTTELCEGPGIDPNESSADLISALSASCAQHGQNYSPSPAF
jgi:hypothetical protein